MLNNNMILNLRETMLMLMLLNLGKYYQYVNVTESDILARYVQSYYISNSFVEGT